MLRVSAAHYAETAARYDALLRQVDGESGRQ